MKKDIASLYYFMDDFVKNQEDNMNKHQIKSKSSLAGLNYHHIATI